MSAKTESPVNRSPNARAHNEDPAGAPPDSRPSRGSPSLDSRYPWHNGILSFSDHPQVRVHSSYILIYFGFTSSRRLQQSLWQDIAWSFLLLLSIALLLSLLYDDVALLLSANYSLIIALLVVAALIIIVPYASAKLYTPYRGIMFALKGFDAFRVAWDALYKAHAAEVEQDKNMVDAKRKINAALTKLLEMYHAYDDAGRWERLAILHWGTAAVHAYDAQSVGLAVSIRVFEMSTETRDSVHFPPTKAKV
ncbi:hypothetical protein B0H11DRAFT_2072648 [Mycena galericulata]|nr:hypothetical protein B0H11DRAFT_2072648 [Mycena galericulata]